MLTPIGEYFSDFFNVHQKNLQDNYPGIHENILYREFCQFIGHDISKSQLIDSNLQEKITTFCERALIGEPFAYISNSGHFYGRDFYVNPSVLIPRQETEVLVEEAINLSKNFSASEIDVLDLATGSGVIGLTISCELKSRVSSLTLSDICPNALNVAGTNACKFEYDLGAKTKLNLIQSDLLKEVSGEFHLIVSNPPYIKEKAQRNRVHQQVLDHEPALALFIKDSEYNHFFEKLFLEVRDRLKSSGIFLMEGHEDELESLADLWRSHFSADIVEVLKDLTGRVRFLKVQKGVS